MDQEHLNPELAALEAALAELAPRPTGVARDRLMFLAGQAAATPGRKRQAVRWAWSLSLSANVLLAVALGGLAVRGARPVERLTQTTAPASLDARAPSILAAASYGRLRALLLEQGAEGLPNPPAVQPGDRTPPIPENRLQPWLKELGQS